MWEMCKECCGAGPVLRGAPESCWVQRRGAGTRDQVDFGNRFLQVFLGGGPGTSKGDQAAQGSSGGGVDVQRAWARGCISSHPAPRKARCAGKGPRNPQRPQPPARGGAAPHSQLWGLSLSLFLYPFKYPKKEILELEEMRNVPSIQSVSYKTSGVAGASRECCLQGACRPRIIPMLILRLLRLQLEELLTLSLPKC